MLGISLGWSLTIGCEGASAQDDEAQALQTLRSEIRILEDRLASQHAEREGGLLALKEAELRAAVAAGVLRDVREHLASQLARQQRSMPPWSTLVYMVTASLKNRCRLQPKTGCSLG